MTVDGRLAARHVPGRPHQAANEPGKHHQCPRLATKSARDHEPQRPCAHNGNVAARTRGGQAGE